MSNFTAEQIVKINEIFSRIVDCKGNLKVFKDFDFSSNKISDAEIKALDINISNFEIRHIKNDQNINRYFSALLNKFPNEIKKDDLVILYTAFYDILEICDFDVYSNDAIFYLNTFESIIDYFKDNNFDFNSFENNKMLDTHFDTMEYFNLCYVKNKFVCEIKLFVKENYEPLKSFKIDWDKFKNSLNDGNKELFEQDRDVWERIGKTLGAFYGLTQNGSKNIIYYGALGTGKTKFVKDCLDILDPNHDRTEWVQFHSGFEYEDFIDGIKPIGIQNGNLNLALTNGIFKEFCLKAAQNTDENFFFIVDEINRADIAAVFGETLSLLEENYREESIKTKNFPLSNQEFFIPANIYFIGMMNDVDKSIDCFDLALRRRFTWILMECDYGVIENATDKTYRTKCENLNNYITNDLKYLVEYEDETRLKIKSIQSYDNTENRDEAYNKLFPSTSNKEKDKKRYEKTSALNLGRAYEIGHSYFLKKAKMSEQEIWDRHIEPILREYIRTQFSDGEVEKKLETAKKIFVG